MSKLALQIMGTKNELQRRLREELRNRGIDVNTSDFKDEEERELQAPSTPSGIDISSVLAALMEKMIVITEEQEASRAEIKKMQEASRAENK